MTTIRIGTSRNSLADLPVEPDAIEWGLQDVSSSDAGRTQDADSTMHKNRVAQKRKVKLTWNNPSLAAASAILQAVNPEYFYVRYLDVMAGGYETREFYVGDRSAPFRQIAINDSDGNKTVISTLTFDIIER